MGLTLLLGLVLLAAVPGAQHAHARMFDGIFDHHSYVRTGQLCAQAGGGHIFEDMTAVRPIQHWLHLDLPGEALAWALAGSVPPACA